MRKLSVREMHDDKREQVLMHQVIHLPFPCETEFIVKEKKDLHYVKFLNGEVFLFLHLVEVGGHPNTALPEFCMYQTVWHLIWMN